MVTRPTKSRSKGSLEAVQAALTGQPMAEEETPADDGIKRDIDISKIDPGRLKLVTEWQDKIRGDKKYFDKKFKRMREDMEYARLGADKKWVDGDNYTVPITNRFINQAVAALYAKSPKAQAKRKPKLLYTLWDGKEETAKAALQLVQTGADQDGQAQALLEEIQKGQAYNLMMDRMGRTLEILFEYYTGEDFPDFKSRMKALVRRAKTVGVGYIEVQFHRAMEADPDITVRIGDMTQKIAVIEARQSDLAAQKFDEDSAQAAQLKQDMATLEEEKMRIVTEGLMFDFPRSTDIIPSKKCKQLVDFISAPYVTREYHMDTDEVKAMFKVDVTGNYKAYTEVAAKEGDTTGSEQEGDREATAESDRLTYRPSKDKDKGECRLWRVFNKESREELWLCEGYPDFLREPKAPEVQVDGFWTLYPLTFNDVEDEKEIFPPSDVHFLKHPQREYNNVREGLREHRRANRPKFFVKKGVLEESEKRQLESAPPFTVFELKGIEGTMTIDQLIQPYKGVPIDPNLYETGTIIKDILYGVGAQSADMGSTGDTTATESNIAEHSRMSTNASNVDDLDNLLSRVARVSCQIMLQQLDKATVIDIVGPGAIWPDIDPATISKELYLTVKAGSSGRPNQASDLANLERAMPTLLQLGGVNPKVIAKKYAYLLDVDEEEFIVEGMPSILTINAMAQAQAQAANQAQLAQQQAGHQVIMNHQTGEQKTAQAGQQAKAGIVATHAEAAAQPSTGNAATDPAQQGAQGGNNTPGPLGTTPGAQAAFPTSIRRYTASGAPLH